MEFIPMAQMGALLLVGVNFFRMLRGKDWDGALTQLSVWVLGVVLTFVFAQSDWAESVEVGNHTLATLNGWSQVIVGLTLASITSTAVEVIKAVDNTRSSEKPSLFNINRSD